MDLFYDGNGILAGYTQRDSYTDWAGAQYTNVYSREMTRDGDRILTEKVTSIDGALLTNDVKNVKYMYDAKGASGMIVDGTKYYFRKNIFGDVVEIYNESGAKCAEYAYDAWGTCYLMLDTDGVGSLNPFRYRGYYFVSRIGLYYLTTRFYDYTTGRFINADVPSICFDDGLTLPEGCNLYSYCRNNPISYVDPTGHVAISTLVVIIMTTVGVIVGGVYAYDKAYNDGARDWELFGWTLLGAVIGGFIGFGIGRFLGSIASNLGNMSSLVGTLESVGIAVSPTSLGQVAGVIGSFILFSQNANRFKPKDSRSNKSQNKEFQRIADEFDLNEKQRRRIHDKISKKGYSKDEILEIIRKLFPWLFK